MPVPVPPAAGVAPADSPAAGEPVEAGALAAPCPLSGWEATWPAVPEPVGAALSVLGVAAVEPDDAPVEVEGTPVEVAVPGVLPTPGALLEVDAAPDCSAGVAATVPVELDDSPPAPVAVSVELAPAAWLEVASLVALDTGVCTGRASAAAAMRASTDPREIRNFWAPGAAATMPSAAASCSTRSPGFGIFDAERRVLTFQETLVLDRATDAGVELEHPQLHRDDPDQRKGEHPDPGASAQQAVEQPVLCERPRELDRTQRSCGGGGYAPGTPDGFWRPAGALARRSRGAQRAYRRSGRRGGWWRHASPPV
jgi:hypothetical protein